MHAVSHVATAFSLASALLAQTQFLKTKAPQELLSFEVVSGLKEGDNIVGGTYQAIRELKDGATVRAQKEQPKKSGDAAKS